MSIDTVPGIRLLGIEACGSVALTLVLINDTMLSRCEVVLKRHGDIERPYQP
jgi:hypothetical protein